LKKKIQLNPNPTLISISICNSPFLSFQNLIAQKEGKKKRKEKKRKKKKTIKTGKVAIFKIANVRIVLTKQNIYYHYLVQLIVICFFLFQKWSNNSYQDIKKRCIKCEVLNL